jgi:MFS family permease
MAHMAGFASPRVFLSIVLVGALSLYDCSSPLPKALKRIANLMRVQSYGVYLAYYLSEDVFPGATPMDFALIGGFNFAFAMIVDPIITLIARKFNTRLSMLVGVTLLAVGCIPASFADHIWHLYLSQSVLIGLGVGFTYIPSIAIISQWFLKKRSLANGISAAGSGIGGSLFSFIMDIIIRNIIVGLVFQSHGIYQLFHAPPSNNVDEEPKPSRSAIPT